MSDKNPETLYEAWGWVEPIALATGVVIGVAVDDIWGISTIAQIVIIIVGTLLLERALNWSKSILSE